MQLVLAESCSYFDVWIDHV